MKQNLECHKEREAHEAKSAYNIFGVENDSQRRGPLGHGVTSSARTNCPLFCSCLHPAGVPSCICKAFSATERAKTAGNWLNRQEKCGQMGCNACSAMQYGMKMGSVTNCASTSSNDSGLPMPLRPSTRPVFPKGGTSRREWPRNIVEPPNASKIARWECFSPT